MTDNVKSINRRQTLFLAGTLTTLTGAALATLARAAEATGETSAEGSDEAKSTEIDELAATDLVGYELRVIKPGEVVTMEYNPGRVSVVIDAGKRITKIYIG